MSKKSPRTPFSLIKITKDSYPITNSCVIEISLSNLFRSWRSTTPTSYTWHNPVSIRPPPEREITKIPLKFQKQSTKAPNTYSQRKAIKERNLPKARSEEAPASARRLTIFGTSNVVNNLGESDLSKELGVPVRIIPAMRLDVFQVSENRKLFNLFFGKVVK